MIQWPIQGDRKFVNIYTQHTASEFIKQTLTDLQGGIRQ